MTIRQIIVKNQLPVNIRKGMAMSFLGNYVRDEIFGVGNPSPFGKVEEDNNMVNDYPAELIPHVISLINEVIAEHPEWRTTGRSAY